MEINVCNKHHGPIEGSEYIGRGSPLGNPFRLKPDEPRGSTIERYREYLREKIDSKDEYVVRELTRLYKKGLREPLNIVCFCAPKPCHGDVIKSVLLTAHEKVNKTNL